MPIRERLPAILRGDDASELSSDDLAHLEQLADDARQEGMLPYTRDEAAARLRQASAPPGVEYLLAAVCALMGEVERAHQTLLSLGEKLLAAKRFAPLRVVAERALELETTHAAVRLLVAAHEGLGRDPDRIEALERAWALQPDDLEIGLLLAVRLSESGDAGRRRDLLLELLPRFAAAGRHAGLEEAALEFAERDDAEGLLRLIETLPEVVQQGGATQALQLLDIAFPGVAKAGRAGEALPALRLVVARVAEKDGPGAVDRYRPAVLEAVRQGPAASLPDPAPVLRASGLEDDVRPVPDALERFDAIAALPPGAAVHHDAFGAGRVVADDGEVVTMDFAHARGHRMPYHAARRTLARIGEGDLRLLRATAPAELEKLRKEMPVEMILRALEALGGAADAQKLKMFLVGSQIVPATEWNAFWKKARAAAGDDARIDTSRAFEQHYRITAEGAGAESVPLPALELRKSLRTNLTTLRKFLSQHPTLEPALAQRFGRYVARALADESADPVDRARAGLYFARWFPQRAGEWRTILKALWEQGLAVTDLAGEDEQLALLEVSHAVGVESDAILSALDSRFAAVHARAVEYRERLDPAGQEDLRRTLLEHAARYPTAALRRIEQDLESGVPAEEGWRLFTAALSLVEDRPKPSVAEKVVKWVAPQGAIERVIAGAACPESVRLRVRVMLRQWRSSDRFLFPAIEAAERLGLADEAEAVRAQRQKRTERLFDGVGQQAGEADIPVMTRATWERLQGELERLQRELRTTIPAAIQRARELGDLRENAEYHSAKLKQSNVSKLVASLQLKLSRARFVEELVHKDDIVGLGTEVMLEGEGEVVSYWILGEDEHHHGDNVVSHKAAIGRALIGHTIGDEVELGEGPQRARYRIVSMERRLPSA